MSQSVLYEVVISVDPEIHDEYMAWLRPHMDQMLTYDGFISVDMFVNKDDETEITCHYRLRDMASMNAYLSGPAQEMRADGIRRFGEKISAKRRILIENQD